MANTKVPAELSSTPGIIDNSSATAITIDSAGAATFSGDANINSLTVGRGSGSVASNTAVGSSALAVNTTGYNNTAIGLQALYSNTTGFVNIAVGYQALYSNTEGYYNTAMGYSSLYSNTTGEYNTAYGIQSLYSNTTGYNNTAIGLQALYSNTTGNFNTASGGASLMWNTTGTNNTANGDNALYSNTEGNYNTASGAQALRSNTTGTGNIGIGYRAGDNITTGSNNTIIGEYAGTAALEGTIVLAAGSTERLRIDSTGNVGIGTNNPSETLELTRLGKIGFGMNGDYGVRIGYFDNGGGAHGFHVDTKAGGTTVSESRFVVRADSGNVGIGTDNPVSAFEIALGDIGNGANKGLRISNSGNSQAYSIRTGITTVNNHTLAVYDETAGANRLVISNTGNVGIGTDAPGFPLDVSASIGSTIGQTSTHGYSSNRNWAMRTNNYGSANWGGWSLEQSTGAGVAPTVARIGVHLNGNVGIKMGGAAGTGGTENPATALHVGGDITVGSAESVGTGAAAAIRFVNDNERARITSNYASGGGGQMGFWTDSTGGTLVQRAYIKNNGEVNLQAGLRLNGYNYGNSDVFKTYHIDGPGSSTTTRTININTYFGFTNGTGGYFMMSLHGWQTDSAAGLIHWHNGGSGGPMTSAYFEPFYTPTGLTVSVAKGTGDYDIDITLTGTHTNTHGWRMNVWG